MALTDIRDVLGEDAVIADQDWISINSEVVGSDLNELEEIAKDRDGTNRFERLANGLNLVGGEPLEGCDMDWATAERFRICDLISEATLELMSAASSPGERQSAIQVGKRVLRLVGLREDIHIALIKLYVDGELPSLAIAQFEELERQLDDQWGEKPSKLAMDAIGAAAVKPTASNLPRNKRPLLGRDELLDSLTQRVFSSESAPIHTLVGPGGSGKTSLAISLGRKASVTGLKVWFVELGRCTTEADMLRTISQAVGLQPGISDQPPLIIIRNLEPEHGLLVLDNFEQLPSACGQWVAQLAARALNVQVLVTSRSPLSLHGEVLIHVPPLAFPERRTSLEESKKSPAVALFEEEAKLSSPTFEVTASNIQAIIELCRKLDGLPLAIELAAARMATQSPSQVLADIQLSSLALRDKRVRADDRHQGLSQAVEWSYRLLSETAQEAFLRLSIYRGRFIHTAVDAQLGPESHTLIEELVRASLLNIDTSGSQAEHWYLETMRDYASELLESAPFRTDCHRRYVRYWSDWADHIRERSGLGTRDWLNLLLKHSAEVGRAIEISLDFVDLRQESVKMLKHMSNLMHLATVISEYGNLSVKVLNAVRETEPPNTVAEVCGIVAIALMDGPRSQEALDAISEGISLTNDHIAIINLRYWRAHVLSRMREYEKSLEDIDWALEHIPDEDRVRKARIQLTYSRICRNSDANRSVLSTVEEALQVARTVDTPILLANCLEVYGVELGLIGKTKEGLEATREGLQIVESLHSITNIMSCLVSEARLLLWGENPAFALTSLDRAARTQLDIPKVGTDPRRYASLFARALRSIDQIELAIMFMGKTHEPGLISRDQMTLFESREAEVESKAIQEIMDAHRWQRLLSRGKETPWPELLDMAAKARDEFVTVPIPS